jgi:plastin-1
MDKCGLMDDDVGDSREERAFRMWMNSLGIDDLYVNNLFEDVTDGLVLLKVLDKIEPGIVFWKKVEMKPTNKFKKVTNNNYVILLGKQLKFSLVGLGGEDIHDGKKKLVLGLVWQMMRYHTLKFLAQVQAERFGGGPVNDQDLIKWANESVRKAGRSTSMVNFQDKTLNNGLFFLDLLYSVESRIIDWDLVTAGNNPSDSLLNAKYAISIARKLGATIFLLPEDVVEVKPKMIMTFVASIMAISK